MVLLIVTTYFKEFSMDISESHSVLIYLLHAWSILVKDTGGYMHIVHESLRLLQDH